MNIRELVNKEEEYIVDLRRYFHRNPEPSLKEYKTAEKIEEELKALDIPFERVGETGVIGYIKGKSEGKTVALRADIDALEIQETNTVEYASINEGLMHACGHDAHTASLLGADDFADLQLAAPGVYVNVGVRNPEDENTQFPHHNGRFNIDEKGLLISAELYVNYAFEYLNSK